MLAILIAHESWQDDAACIGQDQSIFFDDDQIGAGVRKQKADLDLALTFCSVCTVRRQCYEGALRRKERHGIWGGVDFTRRRNNGRRRQEGQSFDTQNEDRLIAQNRA